MKVPINPLQKSILIIMQLSVALLLPVWLSASIHYLSFPLRFLYSSPSTIPDTQRITQFQNVSLGRTLFNVGWFSIFFVLHFIMATIKYKTKNQQFWPGFVIYQRLIYNLFSSVLLLVIVTSLQPQNYVVFQLSWFICIPFEILGNYLFLESNYRMRGTLFLPYSFKRLYRDSYVDVEDYKKVHSSGIESDGTFAYIRHPMQAGCLLIFIFGHPIFTFERVVMILFLIISISIGVRMEQNRLKIRYTQYHSYMQKVKARFIPFII